VAVLRLNATPRPGLVVQSGSLYTKPDVYGPLGPASGAGEAERQFGDVDSWLAIAWAAFAGRALRHQAGPIRGPGHHPTTCLGSLRQLAGRASPEKPSCRRPEPNRSSGDHHPGEGRAATRSPAGRWRRRLPALGARLRTSDSDHHRPGPGRGPRLDRGPGPGRKSGSPLWAAVRAVGLCPGISTRLLPGVPAGCY
jgi:hypothetical protein